MTLILSLIQILGPVLVRGAEAGTLVEIVETTARLIDLIRPLLVDAAGQETLDQIGAAVRSSVLPRAAQPEDPVFARQGQQKFGGR